MERLINLMTNRIEVLKNSKRELELRLIAYAISGEGKEDLEHIKSELKSVNKELDCYSKIINGGEENY